MGVYSGYADQGTTGETFFRGKQVTDANGVAQFDTVYPGWYPTRAVHIHYMAYTDEGHLITSQLYFPDAVSEAVYRTESYAPRGPHPVTNDADGIFPGDTPDGSQIGSVTETADGYTISLTVGVGPDSGGSRGFIRPRQPFLKPHTPVYPVIPSPSTATVMPASPLSSFPRMPRCKCSGRYPEGRERPFVLREIEACPEALEGYERTRGSGPVRPELSGPVRPELVEGPP